MTGHYRQPYEGEFQSTPQSPWAYKHDLCRHDLASLHQQQAPHNATQCVNVNDNTELITGAPIIGPIRLSASLLIIGISHLTIGIGRLFVLASKTTKNAFNCSSH